MTELALYVCENERCTLGSRDVPGHFTGGISQEQAIMLSGDPGSIFGEGICPNCGVAGTDTGETHESVEGDDPNQDAHDAIMLKVLNPKDKLDAAGSQAAFEKLIEKGSSDA